MQGVFNPTPPFSIRLSFIPLDLQVLTAIWHCQPVAMDAVGSKGHCFISPYQAGIDFSLITEGHEKRRCLRAKCHIKYMTKESELKVETTKFRYLMEYVENIVLK